MKKHLILIGFMGTGKTTIGSLLAKKLKLAHIDTDSTIESVVKCSIPTFFQKYGEEAFREKETDVLAQLIQLPNPTLITTGGGIVLHAENRELMQKYGWVFALDATPLEIIQRLQSDTTRPLLQGGSLEKRVHHLYQKRRPLYQFADYRMDTSTLSVDQVVSEIENIWYNLPTGR
jgi:shikimate kinase